MSKRATTRNGRAFGVSQFSRMLTSGDCPGHYGFRETLEDSSGRAEIPYKTALTRFYEKWPNWEELKIELRLGIGPSQRTTHTD